MQSGLAQCSPPVSLKANLKDATNSKYWFVPANSSWGQNTSHNNQALWRQLWLGKVVYAETRPDQCACTYICMCLCIFRTLPLTMYRFLLFIPFVGPSLFSFIHSFIAFIFFNPFISPPLLLVHTTSGEVCDIHLLSLLVTYSGLRFGLCRSIHHP